MPTQIAILCFSGRGVEAYPRESHLNILQGYVDLIDRTDHDYGSDIDEWIAHISEDPDEFFFEDKHRYIIPDCKKAYAENRRLIELIVSELTEDVKSELISLRHRHSNLQNVKRREVIYANFWSKLNIEYEQWDPTKR